MGIERAQAVEILSSLEVCLTSLVAAGYSLEHLSSEHILLQVLSPSLCVLFGCGRAAGAHYGTFARTRNFPVLAGRTAAKGL